MAKVIMVDAQSVTLEMNSGKKRTYPIDAVAYEDPEIGDEVKLYKDEDGSIYIDLPEEEPVSKSNKPARSVKKEKKEGQSGLGIAGFVIGVIAIIFSFIPIVNNIAFFIGIIAAVFGIVGAITHKRKGLSIAGVILGILAVVITLALQSMWSKSIDEVSDQMNDIIESADSEMGNLTGENTEELLRNSVNVKFGEFTISKDEYGFTHSSLPVTVTNLESGNQSFSIHVEAVDGSGARILEDYVYANDLGAGQSQTFEVFQYIPDEQYDAVQAATFQIVEVSMY